MSQEIAKQIDVKLICSYNGHSIKPSGAVDVNVKVEYSEMVNAMSTLQMLNNDIMAAVKFADEKPFKLGLFRLGQVNFGGDGESKIRFTSITDQVEVQNLSRLIPNEQGEKFLLRLKASVTIEKDGEDEE